jgi:hypothetical protein
MPISRETDSPNLFITMTANAQWQEILGALELVQTVDWHPDLVCRASFKLNLDELLKDLITMKVFGKVAGYAWTTEYQNAQAGT